jgi:hypothetical protein
MTAVDEYFSAIDDQKLRALAKKLRQIVKKTLPNALDLIKMGVPNYSIDGKGVACIVDYSRHVNLYFFQGAKLSSEILQGTGKGMRHLRISESEDIRQAEISQLLKKAAKITGEA